MIPFRAFSTAALPLDFQAILGVAIPFWEPAGEHLSREQILSRAADAEAIVATVMDPMDAALFECAPKLKIVANFAVGYDNVDVAEATRRGIAVSNTPDVLTDATADLTFALLFAAARRIVEGDSLVRSGKWAGWSPTQLLGAAVSGQTFGIIGYGRIGQAVAKRAAAFGMEILFLQRASTLADGVADGIATGVSLDELFARSDFVSLHCPFNDESRHIIDAAALKAMKPSAILINTARGGCVDDDALASALEAKEIAAAALDVFTHEPKVHAALLRSDRTVLAPHIGSATRAARRCMGELCARAIHMVLNGVCPPNILNPTVMKGVS